MSGSSEEVGVSVFLIPYKDLYEDVFNDIKPLYYILIAVWLVFLFYTLYKIADHYLATALEELSVTLKLSKDLAGLTLLAFGNGAPDFFTALLGAGEAPELVLGSSIGSGLFITTAVFGAVIISATNPLRANYDLIPDSPSSSTPEHRQLMSAYSTTSSKVNHKAHFHLSSIFDYISTTNEKIAPLSFIRNLIIYFICVILLTIFTILDNIPLWLPCILVAMYVIYMICVLSHYFITRKRSSTSSTSSLSSTSSSVDEGDESEDPHLQSFSPSEIDSEIQVFKNLSFSKKLSYFIIHYEIWNPNLLPKFSSKIFKVLSLIFVWPIYFLLSATILPNQNPSTSINIQHLTCTLILYRIRRVLNPFFSLPLYVFLLSHPYHFSWELFFFIPTFFFSLLFSIFLYFTSSSYTSSPRFYPIHIFYSFSTCILWIYAGSGELISCLSTTGDLAGISQALLGILVLSWGNSFGDLAADVAISQNGGFETATTAVYSGPTKNVLLSMGVGFLIACIKGGGKVEVGKMEEYVYVAVVIMVIGMVVVGVTVGLVYRFRVRKGLGLVLLVIYGMYVPLAVLMELNTFSSLFDLTRNK